LVTIVFTDLEDSTRRWEDDPDIMDAALGRHDAILRAEIERFSGVVTKHRGDGVMAIFDRPANAVRAALAAQLALQDEQWPGAPLRVRMGIHTGEVRSRAGDIFGPDVNLAARIENAAHGGQILISASTEPLVRRALPPLATVTDLGHWVLRNVHAPQQLFEVGHRSLRTRFPRIRAFRPGRSSLPVPPSTYVDAAAATARLASMLADARLVSVVGPGGVGKSRLAIEVAIRAEDAYTDGARWCPLANIDDPSFVPAAVASHLDLGGALPSADVFDVLRDRHVLMLIDNCEHVQTAVRNIVARILRDCPDVTVLATSREPLRLAGERVFVVAPMISAYASGTAPAVTLFLDRASTAGATIDDTTINRSRIAALCARLDGLPLAIELAAARTRSLGLDELERRLDERFQLLASDDAIDTSSPLHHRKLRDTVAWSYDLLDQRQRLLFERLAVFRGGLSTDAAAAVCGDVFTWEALVETSERSLVQHDVSSPVTRYELSETVRAFALERLIARGDEAATAERHAQYFCAWAERADRERSGPNEAEWVERELAEVANLRAATAWAVDHAEIDLALRLYVALYELASLQGHVEIFDWLDPFAYLGSGHQLAPAALAMAALRQDPSTPASLELAERAASLQETTDLPSHRLLPWAKGFAEASRGERTAAAAAYREGVELIASLEGENGHWISTRALVAMLTRDPVEARDVGVDARRVGQPTGLANALLAIARTTQADDATNALELTRRAYALAESVQNVRLLAYADLTAAGIASRHATPEVALGHLLAALDHAVQARHHEPMWLALTRIGAVLRRAGLDDAASEIDEAWVDAFPGAAARYPTLRGRGGNADRLRFATQNPPSERELCDRTVAIIDRLRRTRLLATPRQDLAEERGAGP
jgi:predicted ATPase/class 3 adenylate cyclase